MLKKPYVTALALGLLTFVLVGLVSRYLPYSRAKMVALDVLTFPGAFVASFFYPQGIHTSYGAPNWGLVVTIANFMVYSIFWFICVITVRFLRKGKGSPS